MIHFLYKCRLCGETYSGAETSNEKLALHATINLTVTGKSDKAFVSMVNVHRCNKRRLGVSDYIGYEIRKG